MKHKILIRLILIVLGVFMALAAIHGCTLGPSSPTLSVTISPKAGHPPFRITIAAACSATGGTYTFKPPDGDAIESTTGQFTAIVGTYPYHGTVTWTDGKRTVSQSISVGLVNRDPVAHDLALTPTPLQYLQLELIDLSYREAGCHNGLPVRYFGIEDPDYTAEGYSDKNDHFLYRIEVHDEETGDLETVYDTDGNPLPAGEFRRDPRFRWFPGWSKIYPPFPLNIMCGAPSLSPGPTQTPGHTAIKVVRVIVKEWGVNYTWDYKATIVGVPAGK